MSQNELVLSLLKNAWPGGVHSLDLRREYGVGDPGRRAADLRELGHDVYSKPERRGKSNGCRYFLRQPRYEQAVPPSTTSPAPSVGEGSALRVLPETSTEGFPPSASGGTGASRKSASEPAALELAQAPAAGHLQRRAFARGPGQRPKYFPPQQIPDREIPARALFIACETLSGSTGATLEDAVLGTEATFRKHDAMEAAA